MCSCRIIKGPLTLKVAQPQQDRGQDREYGKTPFIPVTTPSPPSLGPGCHETANSSAIPPGLTAPVLKPSFRMTGTDGTGAAMAVEDLNESSFSAPGREVGAR
ncbi:hypothetical protein SKAU_G00252580 [Synaphobranchus kaupii]|uniref:Uncharacterized protein n=1 Tax=Synaphobranchus kaupii TaxID=118154 RepID=A0A9Q1F350_SYNKA|nr:hypothetical protein SKAU_G00252580 [Synaphobranchus kaupii]